MKTKLNQSFDLEYCHVTSIFVRQNGTKIDTGELRAERVYLVRVGGMPGWPEDTFRCHRLSDDKFLGEGDTKAEAEGEARYNLMKESRAMAESMVAA